MCGEHGRSIPRRRSKTTKSKPDIQEGTELKLKMKAKKCKSSAPDDGNKPSDEALAFWGTAVASECQPKVNKTKSLYNERDIQKSTASTKTKQSAPAKQAASMYWRFS